MWNFLGNSLSEETSLNTNKVKGSELEIMLKQSNKNRGGCDNSVVFKQIVIRNEYVEDNEEKLFFDQLNYSILCLDG